MQRRQARRAGWAMGFGAVALIVALVGCSSGHGGPSSSAATDAGGSPGSAAPSPDDAIQVVDSGYTTTPQAPGSLAVGGVAVRYWLNAAVVIENRSDQVAEKLEVLTWTTDSSGVESSKPLGYFRDVAYVLPGDRTAVVVDSPIDEPAASIRVTVHVKKWVAPSPAFPTVTVGPVTVGPATPPDPGRLIQAPVSSSYAKSVYGGAIPVSVWHDADGKITGGSEGIMDELYPDKPNIAHTWATDDSVPIVTADMFLRFDDLTLVGIPADLP